MRKKAMLLLLIAVAAASCTTTRIIPEAQHQARLLSYKRLPHSVAALTLISMTGDTLNMLDRNPYMTTKRYYLNDWYSIQYDSTKKSLIDGQCYYVAYLRHNR